jgi:predicted Zn-dependent protease
LKFKNQVFKFVNNTKSILVAQDFLNAVADTVDPFYKCPPLHSVKNFEVFPDILALFLNSLGTWWGQISIVSKVSNEYKEIQWI